MTPICWVPQATGKHAGEGTADDSALSTAVGSRGGTPGVHILVGGRRFVVASPVGTYR